MPRFVLLPAILAVGLPAACFGDGPDPPVSEDQWFRRSPWRPAESGIEPELEEEKAGEEKDAPSRTPLAAGGEPGPIPPKKWKVLPWKPGSSSDTVSLMRGDGNYTLRDTIVQASARTAFMAYQGGGPYTGTTLENCILRVEPNTVPDRRSYWAMRGYDMVDTTLSRVEITGFGQHTPKHDEGHAIYFNVAGALTLTDCYIHHNGGQGLQLVNRPYETNLGRGPAKGAIVVRNTWFHENSFNPDRAAFQVSIFGTGQDVVLEDVEILAGLDGTPGRATFGGLLIEAEGQHPDRDTSWWEPREKKKGFEPPFTQGRVELTRVKVHHESPNRPIVQIKGCEELIVTDCEFRGGRINLDDPGKPGRDCGRIVWKGNRGDAVVTHRGQRIGVASDDFELEAD